MNENKNCILILSAPRSGSTWLGSLFNSHPNVIYRHEPIARLHSRIEARNGLLRRLKFGPVLSENDRKELLDLLCTASPEVDRPPFFTKSYSHAPANWRFILWTLSVNSETFSRLYEKHFFFLQTPKEILVIKETGWSMELVSIVRGLGSSATLLLVRHPCAIISSVLRGINSGLMPRADEQMKRDWYVHHQAAPFLTNNAIKEPEVIQMDPLTFWALRLRILYDIFLELAAAGSTKVSFLVYEEIQRDPQKEIADLFTRLNITLDQRVIKFIDKSIGQKPTMVYTLQNKGKSKYFGVLRRKSFDPWQWQRQLTSKQIEEICTLAGDAALQRFWPRPDS